MMRNWILGGAGVVVGVLLAIWFVALHFPALNGDTSRSPKLFHEPYNGLEFRYPATWGDVKGARGIADFKGARRCEIAVQGFGTQASALTQDLAQLRKDLAQDEQTRPSGERPAWAGASVPAGSFAMTADKGKASPQTEWYTVFPEADDYLIVTETMQQGDSGCLSDLLAFERTFRQFPRDRNVN